MEMKGSKGCQIIYEAKVLKAIQGGGMFISLIIFSGHSKALLVWHRRRLQHYGYGLSRLKPGGAVEGTRLSLFPVDHACSR